MNADKVEHRGLVAIQSVYNNHVSIVENGIGVKFISTTKRKTENDLKRLIDEFIEERSGVE